MVIRSNRALGSVLTSMGGLILLLSIWHWAFSGPPSSGNPYNLMMNLILGSLGLVGGILMACDLKAGGILAIIAGGAALFFAIIPSPLIGGYWILIWDYWDFLYFEIVLLIVGGIVGTPGGKE